MVFQNNCMEVLPGWLLRHNTCLLKFFDKQVKCILSSLISEPDSSTGPELRAGKIPRWQQTDPERLAPCRERACWPGQVQDPPSDPYGQHQAEDRWVWGLVEIPETWSSLPNTSWRPCSAFKYNRSHVWSQRPGKGMELICVIISPWVLLYWLKLAVWVILFYSVLCSTQMFPVCCLAPLKRNAHVHHSGDQIYCMNKASTTGTIELICTTYVLLLICITGTIELIIRSFLQFTFAVLLL